MTKYWSADDKILVCGCTISSPEMMPREIEIFLRKMEVHG